MANRKKTRNKKLSRKLGNDQGILVIHGVGNQKEGETLQKFGGSLRDRALRYSGSELLYGTDEEILSDSKDGENISEPKKEIKISLGNHSKYDNLYIHEVHWAKDYRKELKNKTLWVLSRIHLIALLLFFDVRDKNFIKNPSSDKTVLGVAFRFYARFLILLALVAFIVSFFIRLFTVNIFLGLGIVVIVSLILILFIEKSKCNLSNDVRIAASLEHSEREEILKKIDEGVRDFPPSVQNITIVAHSQGGYLTHQYLTSKNYNPPKEIKNFVGVGSGLGAIHIISLTQSIKNLLFSWFLFIDMVLLFLVPLVFMWEAFEGTFLSIYTLLYSIGGSIITLDISFIMDIFSLANANIINSMDLWSVPNILICSLILAFPIYLAKHYWYKRIEGVPENIRWEEYSSVRDVVGRITPIIAWGFSSSIPKVVGLLGWPLGVHTKYFNGSSSMPSVLVSRFYGKKEVDKYENMQKYLYALTMRQRYMSSASAVFVAVLMVYVTVNKLKLYGNSYIAVVSSILFILTWKICSLLLILAMRFFSWIIGKTLEKFKGRNKISINIGMYRLTDRKFESYVFEDCNYIEQFSPVSSKIRYIIGGIISVISAVLIIFSYTYLEMSRKDYPGLANVFFIGVIYFFVGLCVILGYSFETLKGVFGGIVGLAILLVIVSLYPYFPHISLLYIVILSTVIVYAWRGWYKIEKIKSVNVGSDYS